MNLYNFNYISVDGNWVHETAIIMNAELGTGNVIMPYSVIGYHGFIRDSEEYAGKVIIGDRNIIGCYGTIMIGTSGSTIIGSDNHLMNYVNVGHNAKIGNNNEIGAGSILCGYSYIGNNNRIKVGVSIRNRIGIGDNNIIGMNANVVKAIENNMKICGNPAQRY